jgi:hypothetical protein
MKSLRLPLLIFGAVTAVLVFAAFRGVNDPMLGDPASTDAYMFIWNAWWLKHSLLHLHLPYYCDWIFAPRGATLALHTFEPVQATLIALGNLAFPYWISYDITVALGLVLAGTAMYLLARHLTGNTTAALAAGLTFLFSPFIMSKTGGHLNMAYSGSVPLFAWALLRALEGGKREAWWLAIAWLFAIWTSLLNGIFAANLALVILGWHLFRGVGLRRIAATLTPLLLVTAPIAGSMVYYMVRYGAGPQALTAYRNLPDIVSYVLPLGPSAYAHALYATGKFHFNTLRGDNAVYLGLLVLPLAAAGWWRVRTNKITPVLVSLFLFALVLSFGQVLVHNDAPVRILGVPIFMPFTVWRMIPFLGSIWQAGRYFVLGYCVIALGIGFLVASLRSGWARLAVVLLVLADYMPHIAGYTAPRFDASVMSGAQNVLDSRRTGIAMYYQTVHERPMVGGYISRSPKRVLDEYRAIPGMDCLFWSTNCEANSARSAAERLSVSHIFVKRDDPRAQYFPGFGFEMVFRDPYSEIWRVTPRPSNKM